MKTTLHNYEINFYIAAWTAGIFASVYHLYIGQEELLQSGAIPSRRLHGLKKGWASIARLQDNSDEEWSAWKHYLHELSIPLIAHFVISECLRKNRHNWLPYWYMSFTTIFTMVRFGFTQILLMISQPLIYLLILYMTKKKLWIWVISILILLGLNYLKKEILFWHFLDEKMEDVYLVLTSLSWIQLRCITFCFDHIDNENEKKCIKESKGSMPGEERRKTEAGQRKNVKEDDNIKEKDITDIKINERTSIKQKERKTTREKEIKLKVIEIENFKDTCILMMGYVLYFPTLLLGPLILFVDFEKILKKENVESLKTRLSRGAVDLAILLFYMFLFELALHYIYFTAMKQYPGYVSLLRNSGFCGAGLFMGLHFYLKYLIMYGISGTLASLEGVRSPPAPRCIVRIHLYSHMWKYFDVGLYRFLVKYMYKPTLSWISGEKRSSSVTRLLAASFTFTFIFAWHGTLYSIFVWSLLNFIGISVETAARFFGTTEIYSSFKSTVLRTDQNEERFIAVISTPSLIMSFVANIYYFAGPTIGQMFIARYFSERWYYMLLVYFCLHACCHGSSALADIPSRSDRTVKTNLNLNFVFSLCVLSMLLFFVGSYLIILTH